MTYKFRLEILVILCLSLIVCGIFLGILFDKTVFSKDRETKINTQAPVQIDSFYPFDDPDWSKITKLERQKRIRRWCENSVECWRQKNGSIPSRVYLDTVMNPQSNKAAENLFLFWDQKRRQVQLAANFARKKTLEYNIAYFKSYPVTLKNQLAAKAQQTNRYFSDEIFTRYIDKKVKRLEAILKQEVVSLRQQIIEYESFDLSPESIVFEDLLQLLQSTGDQDPLDPFLHEETPIYGPELSQFDPNNLSTLKKE